MSKYAERENPKYLTDQLITCIGNKRSLVPKILQAIKQVKSRLNKSKLCTFDAFSGSGIISRALKAHSSILYSNDIEDFATAISKCYLANKHRINLSELEDIIQFIAQSNLINGFITELYAPIDEMNITKEDRVFYTKNNARRIDTFRQLIDQYPEKYKYLLLGPLLSKASKHTNTAGVFKSFYKDRVTKVGKFGGTGSDAIKRICTSIQMELPVLSDHECDYLVFQGDTNSIVKEITDLDVTYIDPPYNQHPYGSNYFMLNLIVNYQRPQKISPVSGIPTDWKRSRYNIRSQALASLHELLNNLDSKFLIISYNNEGFISQEEMLTLLKSFGEVNIYETPYNAFRASRNFDKRSIHVTERLFLVERA